MRSEIRKTDNTVNKEYRGNRNLPVVNLQLDFTRYDNRHRQSTNKQRQFSSEPMATNRFFKIYISPLSLFASFGSDIVLFRLINLPSRNSFITGYRIFVLVIERFHWAGYPAVQEAPDF